jgi:ribosomal protein L29
MAKKKTSHVETSDKDIQVALTEKREALRNFRFGNAGSKSRNVKEGSVIRKEIARLLTEVSRRKHAATV